MISMAPARAGAPHQRQAHGGAGEDHEADLEHAHAAVHVADAAGRHDERGRDQAVAHEDPEQVGEVARVERVQVDAAEDRRQRDQQARGVDHGHEHAEASCTRARSTCRRCGPASSAGPRPAGRRCALAPRSVGGDCLGQGTQALRQLVDVVAVEHGEPVAQRSAGCPGEARASSSSPRGVTLPAVRAGGRSGRSCARRRRGARAGRRAGWPPTRRSTARVRPRTRAMARAAIADQGLELRHASGRASARWARDCCMRVDRAQVVADALDAASASLRRLCHAVSPGIVDG